MNIKYFLSSILLLFIFTFQSYAQKMPKGLWKNTNFMNMMFSESFIIKFEEKSISIERQVKVSDFEEKVTEAEYSSSGNNEKIEKKTPETKEIGEDRDTLVIEKYEILEIVNKEGDESKGVIYLKSKQKLDVGSFNSIIFNQVNPDLLLLQVGVSFETLEEAKEGIEGFKKEIKEMKKKKEESEKPKRMQNISIYNFGMGMKMMKTPKSLAKLKSLPELELKSKDEVLEFLEIFRENTKNYKVPTSLKGPLVSFILFEDVFSDMGYNPYTTLRKIGVIMKKYKDDEDVKKANEKIETMFKEKFEY